MHTCLHGKNQFSSSRRRKNFSLVSCKCIVVRLLRHSAGLAFGGNFCIPTIDLSISARPLVSKSQSSPSRSIIMLRKNKEKKLSAQNQCLHSALATLCGAVGLGMKQRKFLARFPWLECGEMFDVRCTLHSISDRGNCFRTNKAKGKCKFSNIQSDEFSFHQYSLHFCRVSSPRASLHRTTFHSSAALAGWCLLS